MATRAITRVRTPRRRSGVNRGITNDDLKSITPTKDVAAHCGPVITVPGRELLIGDVLIIADRPYAIEGFGGCFGDSAGLLFFLDARMAHSGEQEFLILPTMPHKIRRPLAGDER